MWIFSWHMALAALLGGLVGLERQVMGKPAGLRTHMLIALGSALLSHLSLVMALGRPNADPTRIAAQIVTGIGFLGAGAILHARGSVHGLTTAAGIWVVAAIGIAVGADCVREALIVTLVALVVLHLFGFLEEVAKREKNHKK